MLNYEVRNLRGRLGLSQSALGELIGRTRQSIAAYENEGVSDPATALALQGLAKQEGIRNMLTEPGSAWNNSAASDLAAFISAAIDLKPKFRERTANNGREQMLWEPGMLQGRFPTMALRAGMDAASHGELLNTGIVPRIDSPLDEEDDLSALGVRFRELGNPWPSKVSRRETDPGAAWVEDDDDDTDEQQAVDFHAHDLARHTLKVGPLRVSRRLRKQSGVIPSLIAGMRRAARRELMAAAITGNGGNAPTGLLNRDDLLELDLEGAELNWRQIFDMVEALELEGGNARNFAWVMNPTTKKMFAQLNYAAFSGSADREQIAWEMDRQRSPRTGQHLGGFAAAVHRAVPAGTAIFGDWTKLEVLHENEFDLRAISDAADSTTLRAFMDADIRTTAARAFFVLKGLPVTSEGSSSGE